LSLGGYTDWWLPSLQELNKLYIHRVKVGGFTGTAYHSSAEFGAEWAMGRRFDLDWSGVVPKTNSESVRAVRTF